MTITVRDALQIGALVNATVLAGSGGLDSEIKAVDIIDVPDAAIWFRRDSLLSTTFYALKDNIEAQLQMLEDIKSCGGAALIIFSPERYISRIDKRLVQKAEELNLPLLQMPDCSYIDVIMPVMSRVLDKQIRALEYAGEVHRMMTDIVLKGKGLQELLTSLSTLMDNPVLMADAELHLLGAGRPPGAEAPNLLLKEALRGREKISLNDFYPHGLLSELLREKKPAYYRHGSARADYLDFFYPVIAGDNFYGTLILPDLEVELDRAKTVAMEAGAMAIALDALKVTAIRDAERKNELEFYSELLLGNIKNRENIISQSRQFGLDASGSYYVIIVEMNKESIYYGPPESNSLELSKEELEKRLFRVLQYTLEKENSGGVVVEALGSLVILARVPSQLGPEESRGYGKELLLSFKEAAGKRMEDIPVYMAAGDYCPDIERISACYMEAWETIDIGKKLFADSFAFTYADMAPYHMVKRFLANPGTPELFNTIYDPLLRYDREKGGELVLTLETYLECNFSRTKTAEKMHLHRNSLNYRLQKIEELLGRDVDTLDTFPLLLASISRRLSG